MRPGGRTLRRGLLAGLVLLAASIVFAKPPLQTVDMPATADGQAEFFLGYLYDQSGIARRSQPDALLAVGLSDREEVSAAVPYQWVDGHTGLGDVRLGTKYMLNYSKSRDSGLSAAFEAKLKNGSQAREIGTGAVDYDGRIIAQESWKKAKGYFNLGQTWVGSPLVNGQRVLRHNVRYASAAVETLIKPRVWGLSEILWSSSSVPDTPYRLSANTGVRYGINDHIELIGTLGRSLREANRGGPTMRYYAGMRFSFASLPPDK